MISSLEKFDPLVIKKWIQEYLKHLQQFIENSNLPELHKLTIDHLAIKAANTKDYEKFLSSISSYAQTISFVSLNERRLATVRLVKPFDFTPWGNCFCLEVMEPRPAKVGKDLVGFEHIELFTPDLEMARNLLLQRKVLFEEEDNGYHQALVITLPTSQEVKITNSHLFDIEKAQLENQESTKVK